MLAKVFNISKYIFYFFLIIFLFQSCSEDPIPKKNGYFRISLPPQEYQKLNNENCAFTMDKSISSEVEVKGNNCFFNISYPSLNAKFYISYIQLDNNINELITQEYEMREKHNAFATAVNEHVYQDSSSKVNALIFDIKGTKAATPLQFFATDSVTNFVRGSLYFHNSPNNDSLAPVINYLKEDLNHMIESIRWK